VRNTRAARHPTRTLFETLQGTITAVDLEQETILFSLDGSRRRVKGMFSRLLHPSLAASLGEHVQLQGRVTRRGRTILSIEVSRIEPVPVRAP